MIITIFIINLLDSSISWQTMFQDAASPVMEGIINLHHDLMFFITFIFFFVLVVMVRTLHSFRFNLGISSSDSRLVVHGTAIEIIWTVIPSLILVVVALPSFALLYSIDEVINPALTLKCIGHQWYWSYEYSDFDNTLGSINFAPLTHSKKFLTFFLKSFFPFLIRAFIFLLFIFNFFFVLKWYQNFLKKEFQRSLNLFLKFWFELFLVSIFTY